MDTLTTHMVSPETGYAIVMARRALDRANRRLKSALQNMDRLNETIKADGNGILPYTTRIYAIHRDINSARSAIYRWESKLLSLGVDVYMERLNSIMLNVD